LKKNVLITGANSYVGTNVEKWLMKEPDKFHVETLDMKDPNWKNFDFSKFDVVFHVAGIAHVSQKNSMKDIYYKVNRDLTIETADKAKASGANHFIFMSSMIVYNSRETRITKDAVPNPENFYGRSKLEAEEGLLKLQDKNYLITILRPPMIYGPNSKGNFEKLLKFSKKAFVFPKISNKRSMLYIDNLCRIVEKVIEEKKSGIFHPKNNESVSTYVIVKNVRRIINKKLLLTRIFNPIVYLLRKHISSFNKLFEDYYYDFEDLATGDDFSFKETVQKCIEKND